MHAIDGHVSRFTFENDADKIVDLSFYRRWRKLRSPLATAVAQPSNPPADSGETDQIYRERMKVNGAAFAFMVVLVLIGTWLVDGLSQLPHHPA
jgi:hypothetical protein